MGLHLASHRGWRTLGASVVGTSHQVSAQGCADACAVRVLRRRGNGSLLVAVAADGAGTSERAADGARLACEAILAKATSWQETRRAARSAPRSLSAFRREDAGAWVNFTRGWIEAAASRAGLESRAFSCTLLVALVDETAAAFFQIGDGAIVYRGADGQYRPALWPQSGEYANCTWFVTDEDAAQRVQSAAAERVHEVALLTDGMQGLALRFASREAHGPFFEPLFAHLRRQAARVPEALVGELEAFLDSPAVNQRTDDDKTLVLATRLPPETASRPGTRRARR